jgi:hypothetical protein
MLLVHFILTAILTLIVRSAPLERRTNTVTMYLLTQHTVGQNPPGLDPAQITRVGAIGTTLVAKIPGVLTEMRKPDFKDRKVYKSFLDSTWLNFPMVAVL